MAKQPRLIKPTAHRPVSWNEKAVRAVLARDKFVLGEIKEDGLRFHAYLDRANEVRVVTREGIEIRSVAERKRYLRALLETLPAGFCIDGEVCVLDVTFEDASGILRRFEPVQDDKVVKFYVWDAFPLASIAEGLIPGLGTNTLAYSVEYVERKAQLYRAFNAIPYPNQFCVYHSARWMHSMEEVDEFFQEARAQKKEGAVIKCGTLPVRNGKVTGQWKLKPSDTVDGVITGLVWGTVGLANEGKVIGFTVRLESGVLIDATGITQIQMCDFTMDANHGAHFIGRYCEVGFMEYTADGSLRHPYFIQFRDLEYAQGVKS